jgi:hypothetical protein
MEEFNKSRFCNRIQGDIQKWLDETILNKKKVDSLKSTFY